MAANVGSGERVLILSDLISVSSPPGTDEETPPSGRILLFLDDSQDLYSKDEFGIIKPLNGGVFTDAAWEAILPDIVPTPTGDITHRGRAAVGELPSGTIPAGIRFLVNGNILASGTFYLKQGVAAADQVSSSQVFSKTVDAGLFSKPVGLPERRIDAPGLVRKSIPDGETVVAPDGSQYMVFGSFTLGTGASLVLEGDADLVIL